MIVVFYIFDNKKQGEIMEKKVTKCVELMRNLVADVQGAPVPGEDLELELYTIWYEHVQKNALNCFEFLNEHFPMEKNDFSKTLDKMFK